MSHGGQQFGLTAEMGPFTEPVLHESATCDEKVKD
jgi:hypothetical protein